MLHVPVCLLLTATVDVFRNKRTAMIVMHAEQHVTHVVSAATANHRWLCIFCVFPSQLCQQVYFELHHCENLRCHTELFLYTNFLLCCHILNGFKLLKPGMFWLWFWSTEEEKSAAATMYEILTVINTKITVLLVVILHSLVDRYSYTSILTLWRWSQHVSLQ